MTEQEAEIKRVISYIRSCRSAGIDTTITIDKSRSHLILNALEELKQYRALGTVDELCEAKEKQEPYKPAPYQQHCGKCKCGAVFLDKKTNYCGNCGQKLDWSDKDER